MWWDRDVKVNIVLFYGLLFVVLVLAVLLILKCEGVLRINSE